MYASSIHPNAGVVCGVQSSLQALLETLSFVASLAFPDPVNFCWLIAGSLASVGLALALTILFAMRELVTTKLVGGQDAASVNGDGNGDGERGMRPDAADVAGDEQDASGLRQPLLAHADADADADATANGSGRV